MLYTVIYCIYYVYRIYCCNELLVMILFRKSGCEAEQKTVTHTLYRRRRTPDIRDFSGKEGRERRKKTRQIEERRTQTNQPCWHLSSHSPVTTFVFTFFLSSLLSFFVSLSLSFLVSLSLLVWYRLNSTPNKSHTYQVSHLPSLTPTNSQPGECSECASREINNSLNRETLSGFFFWKTEYSFFGRFFFLKIERDLFRVERSSFQCSS